MKIQRLVFPEKEKCVVEDAELDESLDSGEVIVRNHLTLVSAGTELAMFTRTHRGFNVPGFTYAQYPFYPGYAGIGEVVAKADDLTDIHIGDIVYHRGIHATYIKTAISDAAAFPVPDGIPADQIIFYALVVVAMTSLRVAPVDFGENVMVMGMGAIGNLVGQLYRLAGARKVAGVDLLASRLEIAKRSGAVDLAFDVSKKKLPEWLDDLGEHGAELVVEAIGIPGTIDACMKAVADSGRIVLLGSPRKDMTIDPYFDIHRKGAQIIGAHTRVVPETQRKRDHRFIIELLQENRLDGRSLVTHRMDFTQAQNAYLGLKNHPNEYLSVLLTYS